MVCRPHAHLPWPCAPSSPSPTCPAWPGTAPSSPGFWAFLPGFSLAQFPHVRIIPRYHLLPHPTHTPGIKASLSWVPTAHTSLTPLLLCGLEGCRGLPPLPGCCAQAFRSGGLGCPHLYLSVLEQRQLVPESWVLRERFYFRPGTIQGLCMPKSCI